MLMGSKELTLPGMQDLLALVVDAAPRTNAHTNSHGTSVFHGTCGSLVRHVGLHVYLYTCRKWFRDVCPSTSARGGFVPCWTAGPPCACGGSSASGPAPAACAAPPPPPRTAPPTRPPAAARPPPRKAPAPARPCRRRRCRVLETLERCRRRRRRRVSALDRRRCRALQHGMCLPVAQTGAQLQWQAQHRRARPAMGAR